MSQAQWSGDRCGSTRLLQLLTRNFKLALWFNLGVNFLSYHVMRCVEMTCKVKLRRLWFIDVNLHTYIDATPVIMSWQSCVFRLLSQPVSILCIHHRAYLTRIVADDRFLFDRVFTLTSYFNFIQLPVGPSVFYRFILIEVLWQQSYYCDCSTCAVTVCIGYCTCNYYRYGLYV